MKAFEIINSLYSEHDASRSDLLWLMEHREPSVAEYLFARARETAVARYGHKIYVRGLIETTNYCRNDCYYCGIRKSNKAASRYRLTKEDIMLCCDKGYELGFRTFVLQGGEDAWYTDEITADIVASIRAAFPDCAITLSLGEKSYDSYKRFFDAGANRYLLRHETATREHYAKLHPKELSLEHRISCLYDLKKIGYQVGCGFMVGSPFQTAEHIINDLMFIKKFSPEMAGIGPFIPHHDTPFADKKAGTAELTLYLLAIVRLMNPNVLLPATTALGTVNGSGRELGVLAGCNVIMPNLSPLEVRKKYMLYDNKISTGDEAAEAKASLAKRMKEIGYEVVTERGDYVG